MPKKNTIILHLEWDEATKLAAQVMDALGGHTSHGFDIVKGKVNNKDVDVVVAISKNFKEIMAEKDAEYLKKIADFVNNHTWIEKEVVYDD